MQGLDYGKHAINVYAFALTNIIIKDLEAKKVIGTDGV
jgi:hypothetical protein